MHGMPSISGTSGFAAVVVNSGGELGTRNGVHVVVNWSSSSPDWHPCASEGPGPHVEYRVTTGAAATAATKPPIRTSRRTENEDVVIQRF